MKFFAQVSSKKLVVFVIVGVLLAFGASLIVSKTLANMVGEEVQARDLDFLFGAIEVGPLAIAKLQSATIAEQDLRRIMNNPKFQGRGITGAQILGGENLEFTFAKWYDSVQVSSECLVQFSKKYEFIDSMNPFEVKIFRNNCFEIQEKKIAFLYSSSTSLFIALVSIGLLFLSILPAAISINKAEKIFTSEIKSVDSIKFKPINDLVKMALRSIELEKGKALSDLAFQVSHDIRSPLSALNMTMSSIDTSDSTKEIILGSIKRINDIADELLKQGRTSNLKVSSGVEPDILSNKKAIDILPIVTKLVEEKKFEFKNKLDTIISCIADVKSHAHVRISEKVLASLLSNLINNAVEALEAGGTVSVYVRNLDGYVTIAVADDGKGMSDEILSKVGQRGFSSGKTNGNGFGLYYAKESIEEANGEFKILSRLGAGTLIEMKLPSYSP